MKINPPLREWFPALVRWWKGLHPAVQISMLAVIVIAVAFALAVATQ